VSMMRRDDDTFDFRPAGPHQFRELVHAPEDRERLTIEDVSGRCRPHATGTAVQQRHTQIEFQLSDLLAQGGLSDVHH